MNINPMILLAVKMIMVSVISLTVGIMLHNVMKKQGFKTDKAITMILSVLIALGLTLRFGVSVYMFQGLFLFFLLLYASISDLTSRIVANHMSISILALSLISVPNIGFTSMLIGGAVTAAIQIGVSLFSHGRYGGADWKIASSCAFLLGWQRGLAGLVVGLFIGIIFTMVCNKIKNRRNDEGFALIPFISIGMMAMFFI